LVDPKTTVLATKFAGLAGEEVAELEVKPNPPGEAAHGGG